MLSTATALPPKSIGDVPIDKMGLAHYFENYERYLGPLRDQPLRFLELGIARGDSLKYWENWLPEAGALNNAAEIAHVHHVGHAGICVAHYRTPRLERMC